MTPGTNPPRFRRASRDDAADVLAVLDEAAAWLGTRGIRQWPARFGLETVGPALDAGQTWLVSVAGVWAATITFDENDPLWLDRPGRALYIHRMARRRGFPELGQEMLGWAAERAMAAGLDRVRLDCVADNPRLCRYYAERHFIPCGDTEVGGAPGERDSGSTRRTTVRRFERLIGTHRSP